MAKLNHQNEEGIWVDSSIMWRMHRVYHEIWRDIRCLKYFKYVKSSCNFLWNTLNRYCIPGGSAKFIGLQTYRALHSPEVNDMETRSFELEIGVETSLYA